MTYYESAENEIITQKRALFELKKHGIINETDIELFFEEMGNVDFYEAQQVLGWLGY